jgi:hypothetical protein
LDPKSPVQYSMYGRRRGPYSHCTVTVRYVLPNISIGPAIQPPGQTIVPGVLGLSGSVPHPPQFAAFVVVVAHGTGGQCCSCLCSCSCSTTHHACASLAACVREVEWLRMRLDIADFPLATCPKGRHHFSYPEHRAPSEALLLLLLVMPGVPRKHRHQLTDCPSVSLLFLPFSPPDLPWADRSAIQYHAQVCTRGRQIPGTDIDRPSDPDLDPAGTMRLVRPICPSVPPVSLFESLHSHSPLRPYPPARASASSSPPVTTGPTPRSIPSSTAGAQHPPSASLQEILEASMTGLLVPPGRHLARSRPAPQP